MAHDGPERGLRAHRNDLESTLPFLVLGPVYLALSPSATLAVGLFVVFTLFRLAYSWLYFAGLQPWRSISFLIAELCVFVMVGQTIFLALMA